MQIGTDPPVNRTTEGTSQIARTAGTSEATRVVAAFATNSDRTILEAAITEIGHSMLVSNSKVVDGTANAPEGTTEASPRMVLALEPGRRK